jgi:hypothetical protein
VVSLLEEVFESCRGSQRALQPLKDLMQEVLPLEPWKVGEVGSLAEGVRLQKSV